MQSQANPLISMMPLILIFVIFYFLLIRPQQKKQKEHDSILKKLDKNDEIVTTGGIHGTIVNVKDQTVTLRIDDNVKIELQKNCVAFVSKKRDA
ncbi:MAG: preprotein translocase subunit YajC [Candidatus Omnitrophica bacterium]|nr:preprotein translocase subunit YajC [Candidatus Omnitrophota bacterium]